MILVKYLRGVPRLGGAFFLSEAIVTARLIHLLIAFTRNSADHETTGAPHGALFNA
jgi:hypothetical protein